MTTEPDRRPVGWMTTISRTSLSHDSCPLPTSNPSKTDSSPERSSPQWSGEMDATRPAHDRRCAPRPIREASDRGVLLREDR